MNTDNAIIRITPLGDSTHTETGDMINNFFYLHGELETLLGTDKGIIANARKNGLVRNYRHITDAPHINGIYRCIIDGIDKPCIGYFYTDDLNERDWLQRGLVCLESDTEGRAYAKDCMEEKDTIL